MQNLDATKEAEFDLEGFNKLLNEVCSISPEEISDILHIFSGDNKDEKIKSEFLLIKSKGRRLREEAFIQVLLDAIVRFTLSYIKRHPGGKNATVKEVTAYYEKNVKKLMHQAKGLFIEKLSKSTSEFGELLLFMLLESKGIVQLLNKMNLKTNGDMPVHGLDAIHVGVDNQRLIFYYGYSKVFEKHTDAIRDAVKEIDSFSKDVDRQDREFDLVSDYIDKAKFQDFSDEIVNAISPYASDVSNLYEAQSIFAGYHWPRLDSPECPSSMELDDYLKQEYKKDIPKMEVSIKNHVNELENANEYTYIVWSLPLSDLEKFRGKFIQRLKSV
jgi:Domain of unknown function (DUF1837).